MTAEEWIVRAIRDLGEPLPPDDADDAALAYADRLLANEEALGRVVRIDTSGAASVTIHNDTDGTARVMELGERGFWLGADGVLYEISNE